MALYTKGFHPRLVMVDDYQPPKDYLSGVDSFNCNSRCP